MLTGLDRAEFSIAAEDVAILVTEGFKNAESRELGSA
jgi:hypothetical protein